MTGFQRETSNFGGDSEFKVSVFFQTQAYLLLDG
jgi:hypothetical protein